MGVFVPFLEDFFSMVADAYYCQCMHYMAFSSPLSGIFFNHFDIGHQVYHPKFSSPLSGNAIKLRRSLAT